jgi:putative aldouronate transport system substrate-binding protein
MSYLTQSFGVPNIPPNWGTNSKGDLVAQWETPQIIEMINWEATIVKAGMMHPDAIAFQTSSANQRFYSGAVVIDGGGAGAWNGDDAVAGKAANKSYVRGGLPPFTASGSGTPSIALGNTAGLFSYLSKGLKQSQITECLRIANYLAAPFGSYEFTLANYGVKTTDWTSSPNGPVETATGLKNVATTYEFLASPLNVQSVQQGYTDVVKANCAWQQAAGKYSYKPLFWNMNVSIPPNLANAMTAATFTNSSGNIMQEVVRGKSTIADFQAAVKSWQKNGGNSLRTFFDGVRAKYGDA